MEKEMLNINGDFKTLRLELGSLELKLKHIKEDYTAILNLAEKVKKLAETDDKQEEIPNILFNLLLKYMKK